MASQTTAARATSPTPAVNGEVAARVEGKFRFADVCFFVLLGIVIYIHIFSNPLE